MKSIGIIDIVIVSLVGLAILLLASIVFFNNRKSPTNKAFASLAICADIWLISAFLSELQAFEQLRLILSKIAYASAGSTIVLILNLVLIFSGKQLKPKYKFLHNIRYLYLIISVVVTLLFLFTNLIINGIKYQPWGFDLTDGKLYLIFPIFILSCALINFVAFLISYVNSVGQLRKKLQFLLVGLFLFIGANVFVNIILRQIIGSDKYYRLGNYSVIFFVGFTAYAIVKHRLMDIRLLVIKSVVYSLTILIIATAYVSVFYLGIERLNQLKLFNPLFLNVAILLLLAYTFTPIKNYIAKHTDRIFAKGYYNFNELLGKMGDITKKNSRSITGLTAKVMQTLTKEMRINKAAFVLTNSPTLASIRTLGFDSKAKLLWDKPTKLAAKASEAIVYDELEEDSKEKEILRKADVQVLIPIKTEQETEAILALGQKKSGDMYTSQDLNLLELVAPQIAIALENAKSFKEKEQRIAELKSINKMFHHIEHFLDLDNLLQEIADEAIKVTGAEGGSLMLLNKGGKTLSIKTARNLHPLISLNTKIKIGEGVAGMVAKTQEPLILNGLRDKKYGPHLKREDIVSAISVPMKAGDKLVGVLNVNRKNQRVEFTDENLNVMTAFASQAAEAIIKAGYYHKIEKLSVKNDNQFKEFTKALAKTVDAKDPYTYGHSEAVTGYAMEIAREMGFSQQQLRVLEIGGRLHDMGKIGISERILNKPGSLTDEEYKAIQRHPEIGSDILRDTSSLKGIKDLILYHHERFDGRGYPTGLKGKDIPLGARILAVADTYDAMTSHRAYRPALSKKIAVAEIAKCSGTQFDPEVAKVFLKILDRKKLRVIKNTTHQAAYIAEAKAKRLEEHKKAE